MSTFRSEAFFNSIKPYPKQEEFFLANAKRIAYGGARGGGKSWAMRTKFILLAMNYPGLNVLLLRRTLPELRENHIIPMQKLLYGIAVYKETAKEFRFTNGSRIRLGYLQNESDVLQYQGQAYEVIGMEEATQFTYFQYLALSESNRLSGSLKTEFTPRMYFTCNPGGVGHGWVKRLFIDRSYKKAEKPEDYVFIPSRVFENEYLMKHNPDYVENLKALPEVRRRAMLEGDWDVFEGQYFTEFSRDKHVIEPFDIPEDWERFIGLDYGLDMTAALFFAYPPSKDRVVIYNEVYEPSLILSEAAKRISDKMGKDKIRYIVASPDLSGRRQESGKNGFDILRANGLSRLISADNSRIAGWRKVREFLKAGEEKNGYLQIFRNCTNIIRCLPSLVFDSNSSEDAANTPHEVTHAPDALRYGLMSLAFLPYGQNLPVQDNKKNNRYNRDERSYINFLES